MRVQRKKGRYPTRTLAILLFVILMVATIFFSLVQFSSEAFFVLQKKNKEPRTEEATDLTNPALRNAMRTLPDASESVGVPLRGRDVPARPESQGTGVGKHEIFTDADDAALPVLVRAGEPKITQAVFLQCLADRLNVDVATRTQRPIDAESATPLIMFPIMMELSDHRAVMCNITNHIRYIMYVDNGGVPEVARFLNNIVDLFGWTGRLVVRSYPWNAGFSGAVNTAIDWALSLPEDEVPFLQVSNNDVRYPPGLYEARVRTAHQLTKKDAARISELQKEIEGEENSTELLKRYKDGQPLRGSWGVNNSLVTSQLLPDRIRYMPYLERLTQFKSHTGSFFFHPTQDFSSFMISRLAALTVGYFDENFTPAYFEDIDYSWRLSMLGFQACVIPQGRVPYLPAIHYGNAIIKTMQQLIDSGIIGPNAVAVSTSVCKSPGERCHTEEITAATSTLSPRALELMRRFAAYIRRDPAAYRYAVDKWMTIVADATPGVERCAEPFRPVTKQKPTDPPSARPGSLTTVSDRKSKIAADYDKFLDGIHNNYQDIPLDAWVRDREFRDAIQHDTAGTLSKGYRERGLQVRYHRSLIQGFFARSSTFDHKDN